MTLFDIHDLKERTILLSENVDAFNYTLEAPAGEEAYTTAERRIGIVWAPTTTFGPFPEDSNRVGTMPEEMRQVPKRANVSAPDPQPTAEPPRDSYRANVDIGRGDGLSYDYSRPSSKHPGGVNVAFVGGHVQFMEDSVSYYVYVKLMTSDDMRAARFDEQGKRVLMPMEMRYSQRPHHVEP
jgi:prepilin-type processing-associated H-X9-DG protein